MKFNYRAINLEGKSIKGTLAAESSREAIRQLQSQGLTVLSVGEGGGEIKSSRRATTKLLFIFVGQLAALLESGIPIDEAVAALEESEENETIRRACVIMLNKLRAGESFSGALEASKLSLPRYFHLLAKSGEITGELGEAMRSALSQWEYDLETRRRLVSALIYPTVLIVTGICAVLLIFILVVPRFASILDKGNQEIPLITKMILVPGTFFNDNIQALSLLAAMGLAGTIFAARSPAIRNRSLEILARLPLFSLWLQEVELGKWATMMATLLANRVELTKALELSAGFISLSNMQNQFHRLIGAVRGGSSLAEAIAEKELMPATAVNLVRVGERTGDMAAMLSSLSKLLDNSIKNRTATILALIEPIAILAIGAVIGCIMAGLILGITSVNDMI